MLVPSMLRLRASLFTRLVVVALLFWAGADLAFPQLCAEDSAAAQTQSGPASDASPRQDDCFCCCHHVVPVILDSPTVLVECIDPPDAQAAGAPIGMVRAVFHPPLEL